MPIQKNALPNSTSYRVKDGDNWQTIAAKAGVTPSDLIKFNFRTVVPEEVNWYLREYVGCNVKTPDGRNWRFSSSANPGILYIPNSAVRMPEVKPSAAVPESGLDILRRNLLDESTAIKKVPLWALHKSSFMPLTQMALKHIDNLAETKHTKLPFRVILFGRAFVLGDGELLYRFPTYTSTAKRIFTGNDEHPLFYTNKTTGEKTEGPKLPEMRYGKPVDKNKTVYTARLPAMLLYDSGAVVRLVPYQQGFIFYLESGSAPDPWSVWNM
ncbi:MAG: LysM peptidoglycan-binding domain-containing protein [Pyrinomonadaceae bacterium]